MPSAPSEHDAGVEEARQAVDHRLLRLRRAQRVDEVALQRGQTAEDVLLAARQRAVDEVDDLPERRLVRHGEDRVPCSRAASISAAGTRLKPSPTPKPSALAPPVASCSTSARWASALPRSRTPVVSMTQSRPSQRAGASTSTACAPRTGRRPTSGLAAQQLEPELVLGEQVGKAEAVVHGAYPMRRSSMTQTARAVFGGATVACEAVRVGDWMAVPPRRFQ